MVIEKAKPYFVKYMQVTFKNLKKRAGLEATTQAAKTLELLRDKPFWI
jgi:hypothetical protein